MSDNIETIGIRMETSDVDRGIQSLETLATKGPAVEKAMAQVEASSKKAGKSLDSLSKAGAVSVDAVAKAAPKAADGLGKVATASEATEKAVKSIGAVGTGGLQALNRTAASAASGVRDLGGASTAATKGMGSFSAAAGSVAASLTKEAAAIGSISSTVRTSGAAHASATKNVNDLAIALKILTDQANQTVAANKRAAESAKEIGESARTGGRGIRQMGAEQEGLLASMTLLRSSAAVVLGGVVVHSAMSAAQALYEASASGERLRTTLSFATGNGAAEMVYLTDLTQKLGLRMQGTAQAYASFAAAARGTSIEGQKTRDIFEAISKASAVMGLSTEQASGALLALQQMVSKGTVQAEELRGQLGERLPGAFQIAAKAMGVTTDQLGKMLEQGQVMADDFLPKFAAALNAHLGDASDKAADRLDASTNRMANAWDRLMRATGDSGVSKAMAGQYSILADAMDNVAESMARARGQGDGFVGQMLAGSGAVLEFLNPLNALSYSALSAGERLHDAEKRLADMQKRAAQGIDVKVQMDRLEELIAALREAKKQADSLGGAGAHFNTDGGRAREQYYARREAFQGSVNSYVADNARQTKGEIRAEEIAKAEAMNKKLMDQAKAIGDINAQAKLEKALKTEIANINSKYADKGAAAAANKARNEAEQLARAQLSLDVEAIRAASESSLASVSSREAVMEATRAAGLLDEADYWASKKALMLEGDRVREEAAQREIDRLKREPLWGGQGQ